MEREGSRCTVSVRLQRAGKAVDAAGTGSGPIEAFVNALSELHGEPLALSDYSEHAIAEGADARAIAYVSLRVPSAPQARFGAGQDEDVVLASFRAIVSAYNRALR